MKVALFFVLFFVVFFKPDDSALGGGYIQSFCVTLSVNEQYRFSAEVIMQNLLSRVFVMPPKKLCGFS